LRASTVRAGSRGASLVYGVRLHLRSLDGVIKYAAVDIHRATTGGAESTAARDVLAALEPFPCWFQY